MWALRTRLQHGNATRVLCACVKEVLPNGGVGIGPMIRGCYGSSGKLNFFKNGHVSCGGGMRTEHGLGIP